MAPETISAKRPLQERGWQNPPCRQAAVDLTWSPPSKNCRRVMQALKEIIVIDDIYMSEKTGTEVIELFD